MRQNEWKVAVLYDRFTTAACISFESCSAPQKTQDWTLDAVDPSLNGPVRSLQPIYRGNKQSQILVALLHGLPVSCSMYSQVHMWIQRENRGVPL